MNATRIGMFLSLAATEAAADPEVLAERRRAFFLYLVLPGAAVGLLIIVAVALWANRVRRRRIERGEQAEVGQR